MKTVTIILLLLLLPLSFLLASCSPENPVAPKIEPTETVSVPIPTPTATPATIIPTAIPTITSTPIVYQGSISGAEYLSGAYTLNCPALTTSSHVECEITILPGGDTCKLPCITTTIYGQSHFNFIIHVNFIIHASSICFTWDNGYWLPGVQYDLIMRAYITN